MGKHPSWLPFHSSQGGGVNIAGGTVSCIMCNIYENTAQDGSQSGRGGGVLIEGDATEVPTGIAEKAEENVEELLEEKTAAESIQRVKYDYARREGRRNQEEKNPVEYCIELGKLAVLLVHGTVWLLWD